MVLPSLFVLGLFTVVRLVDTGVENITCLRAMARIRRHYAGLVPEAAEYFSGQQDDLDEALASMAVRRGPITGLFTIASMIAVVNSVVAGAGATLLTAGLNGRFDRVAGLRIGIGVLVGLVLVAGFFVYQNLRYEALNTHHA